MRGKFILFLLGGLFSGVTLWSQNLYSREEYIGRYRDMAVAEMKRTGIPASITLAQGILESGAGNSRLAREANNHFGIKCHDWTGPSIRHDDDAPGECFRKYNHPEESYRDHSEFLMSRSRYGFLFNYPYNDYINWAHGLKKAGYATNPRYAELLIKIIEESELHRYDDLKYKNSGMPGVNFWSPFSSEKHALKNTHTAPNGYVLYEVNGVKVIVAAEGDSFTSLAVSLNMNPSRLAGYNDLEKEYPLYPGQWVYLQRKKRKAARGEEYHTVREGETLYNVAQQYGIRLENLYQLNKLSFDAPEPLPSTVLYLRKKKK